MHRLGQHFLVHRSVTKKIADALEIASSDTVVEIGGGHGELTVPLGEACAARGARLITIERDGALATALRALPALRDARVIYGDALYEIPTLIHDPKFLAPRSPLKIAGNIPYYLTGRLFRVLGSLPQKPLRTVLMIQKEVALRLTAHPPHMNRLAAVAQFWAEPRILAFVPRTHFDPPPEVDSAVVVLAKKTLPKELEAIKEAYEETVRALFAQPRKTILNNLAAAPKFREKGKQALIEALARAGIDPGLRPQDETVEDIARIARLDSIT